MLYLHVRDCVDIKLYLPWKCNQEYVKIWLKLRTLERIFYSSLGKLRVFQTDTHRHRHRKSFVSHTQKASSSSLSL